MSLPWGGDLARFETSDDGDIFVRVRNAEPGEETPQADGTAKIQRDGNCFFVALGDQFLHPTVWHVMMMLPLSELFLRRGMLTLHAAYIVHRGQGIVFSGPSGIGKSTQAELWRRCRGAQVVNGDRVLLIPGKDGALVASHFFSGTSGICENVTAPLKAIVLLEQAGENGVVEVSPLSIFRQIMGQIDYRVSDTDQLITVTALVERLLAQTAVCQYGCRIDKDAVDCLETHLYR